MIFKYENSCCDLDLSILKNDEFCFSVLTRILAQNPTLTITDKATFIICYSSSPYPVWIWIRDEATDSEMKMVYDLVKVNFGFDGSYTFNTKYFFAKYLMAQEPFKINVNLTAYVCSSPIKPRKTPLGHIAIATEEDFELLSAYLEEFSHSVGINPLTTEGAKERASDLIVKGSLYFWVDEHGDKVATCNYRPSNSQGVINAVFVRKDKRKCGYGAMLVYEISKIIVADGRLPILYADTDYVASNACYKSIGFYSKGCLCTIGKK